MAIVATATFGMMNDIAFPALAIAAPSTAAAFPQHQMLAQPAPQTPPAPFLLLPNSINNRTSPKQVRFSVTDNSSSPAAMRMSSSVLEGLTEQEISQLWYQEDELARFRCEVRFACRQMRLSPEAVQNVQRQVVTMAALEEDEQHHAVVVTEEATAAAAGNTPSSSCHSSLFTTRGLESRMCLERQRRKYLAVKSIVRASQTVVASTDVDRLAALSRRCTQWAAELAHREAARDYQRAYQQQQQQQQQRPQQQPQHQLSLEMSCDDSVACKRPNFSASCNDRRVRQRVVL